MEEQLYLPWKIALLANEFLSCHRWGDQLEDILRLGISLSAVRSSSLGLTGTIAKELLRWLMASRLRVRGRDILRETFSVDVEARLFGPLFDVDVADIGRE